MQEVEKIIENALAEDIGTGDLTSALVIPHDAQGSFVFASRQDIVFCGLPVLEKIFTGLDYEPLVKEGDFVTAGTKLFSICGNAIKILERERVALNFIQKMSGIATLTKQYVDAVEGTGCKILDTRKTAPGLRILEKYAVKVGGGTNHRMGLYDAILIKDNHIAIAGSISAAINRVKLAENPPETIEVECDTMEQVREAVTAGAGMLLLDNMSHEDLRQMVAEFAGRLPLEASGGISLNTVRKIAETGVDFISVGALTHSAPCVDIGLDEDDFKQKNAQTA